jgi:hypothetical protein
LAQRAARVLALLRARVGINPIAAMQPPFAELLMIQQDRIDSTGLETDARGLETTRQRPNSLMVQQHGQIRAIALAQPILRRGTTPPPSERGAGI